jgi:carbon monoxide dehydrogenase subunit G
MARFTTDYQETFTVHVPADVARAYLGDLDRIAENLEEVERVEKTGADTLRVCMAPLTRGPVTFRGKYESRYYFPAENVLEWRPSGPGNLRMHGRAEFSAQGPRETRVGFRQSIEADIEINWLLAALAGPIVNLEMQRRIRRYLERARQALEAMGRASSTASSRRG